MKRNSLLALPLLMLAALAQPAWADDDDDDDNGRRHRLERKEEFWDGPCFVKREWKKNGDFKEERKCDGRVRQPEQKAEFWDGPCFVKREWKKDGDYKEERKCNGRKRRAHAAPPPVYPPWVVVDQGGPVYRRGHEPAPTPAPMPAARCHSETIGQVLGGIAGAAIGNRIGSGGGRAVATAGGAVVGVLIGGEIGRRIDANNQACIGHALEFAPAGQRIVWPHDGTQYAVIPGAVVARDGTHCRPFEAQVLTASGWQKTQGTACRRDDGSWVADR